jgi:uncharacterized protein (DUF1778 family)
MARASTKTETFSVRLDPQTRYLAELAARSQGRSLANFIQMAIESALETTKIETYANRERPIQVRSSEFINQVWDVDEPERLVKLALTYPELLSFEEQLLYKKLRDKYELPEHQGPLDLDGFDWTRIHGEWTEFKRGVQAATTSGS